MPRTRCPATADGSAASRCSSGVGSGPRRSVIRRSRPPSRLPVRPLDTPASPGRARPLGRTPLGVPLRRTLCSLGCLAAAADRLASGPAGALSCPPRSLARVRDDRSGAFADVFDGGAGARADVLGGGAGARADVLDGGAGARADVLDRRAGALADVLDRRAGALEDVLDRRPRTLAQLADSLPGTAADVLDGRPDACGELLEYPWVSIDRGQHAIQDPGDVVEPHL